ncbi:MAG: ACT domain-containing protein [Candidatus Micrarchaeota archaeon]|nr:ACT domain-containing protein [Candidatus Micrarchaeota archaeon]
MATAANLVRLYLKRRPQLLFMVTNGLCNYSALARRLQREIFPSRKTGFNAIKAALLRMAKEEEVKDKSWEKEVERILRNSSVEVRSNVSVVSSKGSIGVPVIATSNSRSGVMSVVDSSYSKQLKKKGFKVIDELSLIFLYSPPELQDTPGCVSVILDAIAAEGINILEFISCHTDTLLVVRNADAVRVYEILASLIGKQAKEM